MTETTVLAHYDNPAVESALNLVIETCREQTEPMEVSLLMRKARQGSYMESAKPEVRRAVMALIGAELIRPVSYNGASALVAAREEGFGQLDELMQAILDDTEDYVLCGEEIIIEYQVAEEHKLAMERRQQASDRIVELHAIKESMIIRCQNTVLMRQVLQGKQAIEEIDARTGFSFGKSAKKRDLVKELEQLERVFHRQVKKLHEVIEELTLLEEKLRS